MINSSPLFSRTSNNALTMMKMTPFLSISLMSHRLDRFILKFLSSKEISWRNLLKKSWVSSMISSKPQLWISLFLIRPSLTSVKSTELSNLPKDTACSSVKEVLVVILWQNWPHSLPNTIYVKSQLQRVLSWKTSDKKLNNGHKSAPSKITPPQSSCFQTIK